MTQNDLCAKLGVTQGALSQWENGYCEPDISSIQKMSKIFGITTDELLGMELNNGDSHNIVPDISENLTDSEKFVLKKFRSMNKQGQDQIIEMIDMFAERYKKDAESNSGYSGDVG